MTRSDEPLLLDHCDALAWRVRSFCNLRKRGSRAPMLLLVPRRSGTPSGHAPASREAVA